jgi:dsDNA-binding SOS-regulon protein
MQYEFLKQFPKRMKHVGRYVLLWDNSSQKTIWKQYGFIKQDEQVNVIFAVLLYIMEQSLKEENCTMDDIGAYIDSLNMRYFEKNMGYEDCKKLGDFILNVVLSNEGKAMYFDGYDFEQRAYQIMNVSYVANRIVYVDSDVRRTSYYLTEDGYNLLLSTLEIENNMKLTIHEMIFKMHLDKQSYDKAVDEIKNVFNLLRIQMQKMEEAMGRIRRNALSYSVAEYEEVLEENLATISDTKQKFQNYRELVKSRRQELEDMNLNVRKLDEKEEEKLNNLGIIENYLNRTIDEHQKILSGHFDLKSLYTRELEQLSQMSFIRRFSIRNELYDKILDNPHGLENMDLFFRPLFGNVPDKIYNPNKVMELQRPVRRKDVEETEERMEFGDDAWMEAEERRQREKLAKYEGILTVLLSHAMQEPDGEVSLEEIKSSLESEDADFSKLIPDVQMFKEVMVELLRGREIDIGQLKEERRQYISEFSGGFQLNEMLLNLTEKMAPQVSSIEIYRIEDGTNITFDNVADADGTPKRIRCSNVLIRVRQN